MDLKSQISLIDHNEIICNVVFNDKYKGLNVNYYLNPHLFPAEDLSSKIKHWKIYTGLFVNKYIIKEFHSIVLFNLLCKKPIFIGLYRNHLVAYRVLKKYPCHIFYIYNPSYQLQKFAFKHMNLEDKLITINDSWFDMKEYFNSSDFDKEYGFLKIVDSIGIINDN